MHGWMDTHKKHKLNFQNEILLSVNHCKYLNTILKQYDFLISMLYFLHRLYGKSFGSKVPTEHPGSSIKKIVGWLCLSTWFVQCLLTDGYKLNYILQTQILDSSKMHCSVLGLYIPRVISNCELCSTCLYPALLP